jgi:ABC-type multidrug transport system fused ATPase/permease subunit
MKYFEPLITNFYKENQTDLLTYAIVVLTYLSFQGIAMPNVYGKLFEKFESTKTFPNIFDFKKNFQEGNIGFVLIILIILWLIVLGGDAIKNYYESILVPEYLAFIREIIYSKTIETYKVDYGEMKTGDYLSRVMELSRNFKDLFQQIIGNFVPDFTIATIMVFYLLYINKSIGLVILTGYILCIIIQLIAGKKLIDLVSKKENFFNGELSENLQDSLDNLMNVYINNESDNQIQKNTDLEEENKEKMKEIMNIESKVIHITHFITLLTYMICLFVLYNLVKTSSISGKQAIVIVLILGEFLNNFMYALRTFIHQIVYKMGIIQGSKDFMEKIFTEKPNGTKRDMITKGKIQYKDIKYRYDKSKEEFLFTKFNLTIDGGKKYALIGRAGTGKTTIMKMLIGLHKIEDGAIYIDDVNINDVDVDYLRENINYVNQQTKLFNEPIIDNIMYGNDHITKEQVKEKMKKYDLYEIYSEIASGIEGNAGVQGGNLSLGMQKVTMLMRGIMKPSKIVILDEPLAGLDVNTKSRVINLILNECKDKTVIIITHDHEIVPYLDDVIDLNQLEK